MRLNPSDNGHRHMMIMPTMFDEVRLFCMLFAARAASAEAAPRRGLTNERTAMESVRRS